MRKIGKRMQKRINDLKQDVRGGLLTKDEAILSLCGWLLKKWETGNMYQDPDNPELTWIPDGTKNADGSPHFNLATAPIHDVVMANCRGWFS